MTIDLMDMFKRHGYDDAFLFGHALEGNLHLVFSQARLGAGPARPPPPARLRRRAGPILPLPSVHTPACLSGTAADSPRPALPPCLPSAGLPHARGGAALPHHV